MRTNVFEKHDAVDTAATTGVAGAADGASAAAATGVAGAADVACAAAADAAGGAGRGDYPETPSCPGDSTPVSMGGGAVGLAEIQMLPPESGRAGGSFRPTQWDRSPAGNQTVKLAQAPRRARVRVVGERRDSMVSGGVDNSGAKGHVSPGGPDGKDSSVDGGSRSVGVGQRFTEPEPIAIPPKLYRIGEIVEHSGLSRQTIHNYTTMGLLIEARRSAGGHRLYDESVFDRLNGIMALKAQHKSLAYIRAYYAKLDAG